MHYKRDIGCTLDKNGSRTATTFTSEGSSPISSFASLVAVSASSTSSSSAFPPGNETSPISRKVRRPFSKNHAETIIAIIVSMKKAD
ncbi:hypothetical protein HanPSC8_Chr11g0484141 [Helianthus annuus]|nr:hypothetical protein HanPSC8_Chr11g0484141 [Helianthus annuus]